jgi:hypothetical protein
MTMGIALVAVFGGKVREPMRVPLRPSILHGEVLALDVAQFA